MRDTLPLLATGFDVSSGENCDDAVSLSLRGSGGIGQAGRSVIVLVKDDNQQTVILFGPLIVAVEVLPQPCITVLDAARNRAIVHIILQVRDHEGYRGEFVVVCGEVLESEVG